MTVKLLKFKDVEMYYLIDPLSKIGFPVTRAELMELKRQIEGLGL